MHNTHERRDDDDMSDTGSDTIRDLERAAAWLDDIGKTAEANAVRAERAARLASEAHARLLEAERDAANRAWEPLCQQRNEAMEKIDLVAEALGRSLLTSDAHEGLPEAVAALRAELEALRAVAEAARGAAEDLTEHVADEDCAGPDGTGRRGACRECRIAEHITDALRQLDEVRRG